MQRATTDTEKQVTLYLLPVDIFPLINRYLNPIDLYFWAITSKFFHHFLTNAYYNPLWEYQLIQNFPIEGTGTGALTNSLFITTDHLKETLHYHNFKNANRKHYQELATKNLLSIVQGQPFFSFFRKKKYKPIHNYFANLIYENNSEKDIDDLILYQVQINKPDNFFKQLLNIKIKKLYAKPDIEEDIKFTVNDIYIRGDTILNLAIKLHADEIVKCLFTLGANPDPNTQDTRHTPSPLSAAAAEVNAENAETIEKNRKIVSLLLLKIKYGAKCLDRALYIAAHVGDISMVKLFVLHGAKINTEFNPLYFAMQHGHPDVVKYLLEKGASSLSYEGFTPLYAAAENKQFKTIQVFIDYHKKNQFTLNIDKKSKHYTPLYIAAEKGYSNICQLLLEQGANVNEPCCGLPPLFAAIQFGHLDVALVLCSAKYKIKIDFINSGGWTALHFAIEHNRINILDLLIERGADVNKIAHDVTPLYRASLIFTYVTAFSIISSLIRAGADPLMLSTSKKRTISSRAANPDIKKILLLLEDISQLGLNELAGTQSKYSIDIKLFAQKIDDYLIINEVIKVKCVQLARTCKTLLSLTFTPFGYAVVLYALLSQENKQAKTTMFHSDYQQAETFTQYIVIELGFSSKNEAKAALLDTIKTNLSAQPSGIILFNKLEKVVIGEIIAIFEKPHEWQSIVINKIFLCLNLFEVKVKKSLQLLEQAVQTENYERSCILKLS